MNPKLNELIEQSKALKARFAAEGKEAVLASLQDIFKAHDKLEQISWRQYTPWFNDGEACTFGLHGLEYKHDGLDWDDWSDPRRHWDDELGQYVAVETADPALVACVKDMKGFYRDLQEIEEVLELAFGDHCEVTVTRKGVEVSEYEHD